MSSSHVNIWQELSRSKILPEGSVPSLAARFQNSATESQGPKAITGWLVNENVISDFQADVLHSGFAERLSYGNYTIFDRLGGDSDWSLFRGVHIPTAHKVLLFFVAGDVPDSFEHWDQIAESAKAWQKAEHPCVVPVLDVLTLPEYRMIVIDDVPGTLLMEKVPEKTRLSIDRCVRNSTRTIEILQSLHRQDIVHGQLRLDAIIFDSNNSLRVFPPLLSGKLGSIVQSARQNGNSDPEATTKPTNDRAKLDKQNGKPKSENGKPEELGTESLAPEVVADSNLKVRTSDIYSLGMLLHRMLAGKFPRGSSKKSVKRKSELADPKKMGYPTEFNDLLEKMLEPDPADRIADLEKIKSEIKSLNPKPNAEFVEPATTASLESYREFMETWRPDVDSPESGVSLKIDDSAEESRENVIQLVHSDSNADPDDPSADDKTREDKRVSRFAGMSTPLFASAVSAGLLALIVAFLIIGYNLGKSDDDVARQVIEDKAKKLAQEQIRKAAQGKPIGVVDSPGGGHTKTVDDGLGYKQELYEDDGSRLWQSPTAGLPINYQLVPPSAQLIMTVRLNSLANHDEGQLAIRAFGEQPGNFIQGLKDLCGFTANEISHLHVSLHSNSNEYKSCFVVRLVEPIAETKLLARWADAELRASESGHAYYEIGDLAFFFKPASDSGTDQQISEFLFGPLPQMTPVIEAGGVTRIDGTLGALAKRTDRNRHITVLMLRSALFSEEGQKLMAGTWSKLNRSLSIRMDDRIKGMMLSGHLDRGFYWEASFDRQVDLKTGELEQIIVDLLRNSRNDIDKYVSGMLGHPYWEDVRVQFDDMVTAAYRSTRVGTERQAVLVNCWLPLMAAHNLIAASEIVSAAAPGAGMPVISSSTDKGPQTLEELLASKRDLEDANPPDLNILIENFKNDILGDFPKLPFEFDIVVNGTDLSADGITRNQRPSALDLKQKTVSEILTDIMFLANPDKNAKSPKDVLCKLIWVVKPDPDNPNKKTIEITTRAAAAAKGYALPDAFKE